ncbi:MAG: hypothetical protein IJF03_05285 [Lachnospiraceae bacterium]|nr:hypothetical protein [Lachnospiraceae bacterium]
MIEFIFGGAAFILMGLLAFIKPTFIWKITEQWKSDCAKEPSKLYIKSTRFGGTIFILLGMVMIIVGGII